MVLKIVGKGFYFSIDDVDLGVIKIIVKGRFTMVGGGHHQVVKMSRSVLDQLLIVEESVSMMACPGMQFFKNHICKFIGIRTSRYVGMTRQTTAAILLSRIFAS